jgi:hypothetical protein
MGINDGQDTQLLACRQLVVNEVHRPHIVWLDSLLAILPKLRLHPSLRMLVPELKAQLVVNPTRFLHVDHPPLTAQQHMDATIAVTHPCLTNFLDP